MPTATTRYHNDCGHRHRTGRALAACLMPRNTPVTGDGHWGVLSHCGKVTVQLAPTRADAEHVLADLAKNGCGQGCARRHELTQIVDRADLTR